jgi:hypothetical protein
MALPRAWLDSPGDENVVTGVPFVCDEEECLFGLIVVALCRLRDAIVPVKVLRINSVNALFAIANLTHARCR